MTASYPRRPWRNLWLLLAALCLLVLLNSCCPRVLPPSIDRRETVKVTPGASGTFKLPVVPGPGATVYKTDTIIGGIRWRTRTVNDTVQVHADCPPDTTRERTVTQTVHAPLTFGQEYGAGIALVLGVLLALLLLFVWAGRR